MPLASIEFVWNGLSLHQGRRKTPVLTLVADATYPHLYRIRYPDGWTSTAANLTRARGTQLTAMPAICWSGDRRAQRSPTAPRAGLPAGGELPEWTEEGKAPMTSHEEEAA